MVRLKDIAAQAGVSVMTVSKSLRGASDISAKTKARVKVLAQQLGYMPDSMAQGLRNRSTKLLGLVLSNITHPLFVRTVSAIEEGAHEWGYDLILAHSLNIPEREEACIRRLLSRRVDGLFIFPVYRLSPTAPIYEELWQRQTPTVILGHRAPFCAQFCNVETDDLTGSYLMTRHLLELGHKKIAFLSGVSGSPWAQERLEGYRRALREAGIEPEDRLIFTAGATLEEGEKAAVQMINEVRRHDGHPGGQRPGGHGRGQRLSQPGRQNPRRTVHCRFWQHPDEPAFSRAAQHRAAAETSLGRCRH